MGRYRYMNQAYEMMTEMMTTEMSHGPKSSQIRRDLHPYGKCGGSSQCRTCWYQEVWPGLMAARDAEYDRMRPMFEAATKLDLVAIQLHHYPEKSSEFFNYCGAIAKWFREYEQHHIRDIPAQDLALIAQIQIPR